MTQLHDPFVLSKPALTPGRTLGVVTIAIVIALVAEAIVALVAFALGSLQSAASPSSWAGVGTALIGVAAAVVCAAVLAVVAVAVGLRGRARAGRFTLLFAATLVAVPVLFGLIGGALDSLDVRLPDNGAQVLLLAGLPLLWVVPAVVLGIVRWRWLAIIAAFGIAVVGAGVAAESLAADRQQAALNEAYTGPIYAPSSSPVSPLAGFLLTDAKLPGPYEDWEGAERIGFSYVLPGLPADGLHDDRYRVAISESTSDTWCDDSRSRCEKVGQALGAPVLFEPQSSVFIIALEDGVITLTGVLSSDQAMAILHDLQPATLEYIAALEEYDE